MAIQRKSAKKPINQKRRHLLQGAACVGAVSFAPAVFANTVLTDSESIISGKLVSKIYDPTKTLILKNHSDQTVVINEFSKSAFMFDGSIVDCNTACLAEPITIPPNQDVLVQFDRRKQSVVMHNPDEFRRIQSRVMRLGDGTRVIPFEASVSGYVATVV